MAISETLVERGNDYGSFENNARMIQAMMSIAVGGSRDKLSPMHVEAFHMIFHKIARMCNGNQFHADSAHDIAGYAILLEEYINEVNDEQELR